MGTEEETTNGGGVATASDTLTITDNDMMPHQLIKLTGPSFVDKTNIDQILPYTANNKR
jgi:hypothetical protein